MTAINDELIGNLSTILKILLLTCLPASLCEALDLNTISMLLAIILGFLFSIIDAKFPNKLSWFSKDTVDTEEILAEDVAEEGV